MQTIDLCSLETISTKTILKALKYNQSHAFISNTVFISLTTPSLIQWLDEVYFHMKYSSLNQSIVLHGKRDNNHSISAILSHLCSLGNFQSQALSALTLLNAFGSSNLCSLFLVQFDDSGKAVGLNISICSPHKIPLLTSNHFEQSLKSPLNSLNLGSMTDHIFRFLSALSLLSRLTFVIKHDKVVVSNEKLLQSISDGLGLDIQALQYTLTNKSQLIGKHIAVVQLDVAQSSLRRDQLVMDLYLVLFHWIVDHINSTLSSNGSNSIAVFNPDCLHQYDRLQSFMEHHLFDYNLNSDSLKPSDTLENSDCIRSIDPDILSLLEKTPVNLSHTSNTLLSCILHPHQQVLMSLDDMLHSIEKTNVWFILFVSLDSAHLQQDIKALKLVSIVKRFKAVKSFAHVCSHQEFCIRYRQVLDYFGVEQNMSAVSRCQAISDLMNNALQIGREKVFIEHSAWRLLEEYKATVSLQNIPDGFLSVDTTMIKQQCNDSYLNETITYLEPPEDHERISIEPKMSRARKQWVCLVWAVTWWIPSPCLSVCGMKLRDIRMAWREKFTLCTIILLMSAAIIWFLVFFGKLVCPHQDVYSPNELRERPKSKNAHVSIRGEVFDLSRFAPHHWASKVIPESLVLSYAGKDITDLFPVQVSALCQGPSGPISPYVSLDYHFNTSDPISGYHDFRAWTNDYRPDWYFEQMAFLRHNYKVGNVGYSTQDIYSQATDASYVGGNKNLKNWAVLDDKIYDLTFYVAGGRHVRLPEPSNATVDVNYLSDAVVSLFLQKSGQDITSQWYALPLDPELRLSQEACLRNLFYAGVVDQRRSLRCIFAEYLLLIVTVFLCLVIVFKFLAALQLGTWRDPEFNDKFVVCQVSCYSEGKDELQKTIDSIAMLKYDDKRKLLFIICDGLVTGGSNDKPTLRIVLDILGIHPSVDPEALPFFSIGEGQKQYNMGKVYSGLYQHQGHVIPYLVVSKVGQPGEKHKPGNRGKRDSQLVLMRFLNKAYFDAPMAPLELEMYYQMENVIGASPNAYEFVLMVDADTEVMPDGLNRLVSAFVHDAKIVGLCGETKLSNEKDSWVTMIQVYEYFISHYMIKAFESLFGTVTCLPGCFCMYRLRSSTNKQPFLISNQVIQDYQVNHVDTLHQKNLLHLGEDRYLTTLILKHFPRHKTKFISDAQCATNAPDQWSVLLSQRRRWINSTIHNLGELVFLPQLCGFCCFSMRFVVMLDLLSTLVQPAIVGYLGYLIYTLATSTDNIPLISIITIAGVYGLQAVIFILHQKWEHIAWMIVSILAIPVFSFYIPIYAYWHFDDFSWGNTRVVLGENGKQADSNEEYFDPETIPTMTWTEYKHELNHAFQSNITQPDLINELYPCSDTKETYSVV